MKYIVKTTTLVGMFHGSSLLCSNKMKTAVIYGTHSDTSVKEPNPELI